MRGLQGSPGGGSFSTLILSHVAGRIFGQFFLLPCLLTYMKDTMFFFWCFTILFLIILSAEDLKSRRVRLLPALIFAGGMFLIHLILADLPLEEYLWGILPGAALFAISLITHSAIGSGDALAVISCAAALGGSVEFAALLLSLLLAAFLSLFLLILRKVSRKDTLPFLPFLLAGHLLLFLLQILQG